MRSNRFKTWVLVSLLAFCPGCVELTGQRIVYFFDGAKDEIRVLIFYDGIHDSGTDKHGKGVEQIPKFVKNGDIMLLDWLGHIEMSDLRRLAENPKRLDTLNRDWARLLTTMKIQPVGYYHEPNGRVGAAQLVTISGAREFVRKFNGLVSRAVLTIKENSLKTKRAPRTYARMKKAAKAGHSWLALEGHSLRFTLPVHPDEWAMIKVEAMKEFVMDMARGSKSGDANRLLLALTSTPISYIETGDQVAFVFGASKTPSTLRFDLRDKYKPQLDKVVIDTVKVDLDASLAKALLGESQPPGPIADVLKWGPPEEQVRALLAAAGKGDAELKIRAVKRLRNWADRWNKDHRLPKAPKETTDADRYLAEWKNWYAQAKSFPVSLLSGRADTAVPDTPAVSPPFSGRTGLRRTMLIKKYGCSTKTETTVAKALAWLKRQQAEDGSWSLSGPYGGGVKPAEPASATAMALLAFQGSGHTHRHGNYKTVVANGAKWLMNRQQESGSWRPDSGHHRMYVHGQCTIALCELYGMTKDPAIGSAAKKAVQYCIKTQGDEGGWRYNPSKKEQSDTSVTGWILMGLRSAKMAGIKVPDQTFKNIGKFLDSVAVSGGSRYGYITSSNDHLAMTAEGLLCRQYLGWKKDDKRLQSGIQYLLKKENLPRWQRFDEFKNTGRDVYYWFFATQAVHHMDGPGWKKWNAAMKPTLVNNQEKQGRESGSWDPKGDKWGLHGGRLYVTCLSIMMLEVYYRHLPLYSKVQQR